MNLLREQIEFCMNLLFLKSGGFSCPVSHADFKLTAAIQLFNDLDSACVFQIEI